MVFWGSRGVGAPLDPVLPPPLAGGWGGHIDQTHAPTLFSCGAGGLVSSSVLQLVVIMVYGPSGLFTVQQKII